MAKPLHERQQSALGAQARLADVRNVAAETETALAQAIADAAAHSARSVDPATAPNVAIEARRSAEDAELIRDRHVTALARLNAKIEALEADEAAKVRLAEYEEAEGERDQLVADLRAHWPRITDEITDLLGRILACDDRIAVVNRALPRSRDRLEPVEALARRIPGNFYLNNSPVMSLTKIKLPSFDGQGEAWPLPRKLYEFDYGAAQIEAERRREEAERHERERWKPYRLTSTNGEGEEVWFNRKPEQGKRSSIWFAGDAGTVQLLDEHEAKRLNNIPGVRAELVTDAEELAA